MDLSKAKSIYEYAKVVKNNKIASDAERVIEEYSRFQRDNPSLPYIPPFCKFDHSSLLTKGLTHHGENKIDTIIKALEPFIPKFIEDMDLSRVKTIKPKDWAEAHGVKVDVVMKLLRDAGVNVRTHMSKIDCSEYEIIEAMAEAEKRKQIARNHNMKLLAISIYERANAVKKNKIGTEAKKVIEDYSAFQKKHPTLPIIAPFCELDYYDSLTQLVTRHGEDKIDRIIDALKVFISIKPKDWAELHGIKVDVVMKLLRDAGVNVRTHMSNIDYSEYKKIKAMPAEEKRKEIAQSQNIKINVSNNKKSLLKRIEKVIAVLFSGLGVLLLQQCYFSSNNKSSTTEEKNISSPIESSNSSEKLQQNITIIQGNNNTVTSINEKISQTHVDSNNTKKEKDAVNAPNATSQSTSEVKSSSSISVKKLKLSLDERYTVCSLHNGADTISTSSSYAKGLLISLISDYNDFAQSNGLKTFDNNPNNYGHSGFLDETGVAVLSSIQRTLGNIIKSNKIKCK